MTKVNKRFDFQAQRESIRRHLNKYTRKAFLTLPGMDKPHILDIGCGSGVPTMELARLSNGEITGLDINQSDLDRLNDKIKRNKLSGRVNTINRSLVNLNFPYNRFDIIWSEGSAHIIGFESCLKAWKRFIKPDGYLVIHDEQGNIEEKLQQISHYGYELLTYFLLDKDLWDREYFAPLEKLIRKARIECADNPNFLKDISTAEDEISFFNNFPELSNSVFFIMRKRKGERNISNKTRMIEIVKQPISLEELISKTKTTGSGCVTTYVGLIRDNSKGKKVASVTYRDVDGTAVNKLRAIADEAKLKWPLENVAITHRIGKLKVGDINLVIAVAAGHRKEGFAACRFIINQFKKKLPTQKAEAYLK
ncbi:MAG: molybdenum cofactor biosynthesis protein MoaE [Dehalococcoidales bacterium]|nr:molybdenum cofactor biosynthesis protein MoaE [Dehalococcoidales bacterium]